MTNDPTDRELRDGVVRALVCDAAGGRAFNLANDFPVEVRRFVALAARGLGRRVLALPVPLALARLRHRVSNLGARDGARRAATLQSLKRLHFMTRDNPFTSERARRELGWRPPVHPAEGIPDAFRWYFGRPPR